MSTSYRKYEWFGDKLLRESPTDNPYADCIPENVTFSSDLPYCDCVSIRRTIKTAYSTKSATIECLYR